MVMSKKLNNVKSVHSQIITKIPITNMSTSPTSSSFPSSPTPKIQSIQSPQNVDDNNNTTNQTILMKRSNSCIENKYTFQLTAEKLAQLRQTVEQALKEHKIFAIKGGWAIIRNELLKRNWIEKFDIFPPNINRNNLLGHNSHEDLYSNLPKKQDWESPNAYNDKCERTIMSRMLRNCDVNFYWHSRKDQTDSIHRTHPDKLMNRFCKSLFASKEGLALLLQQAYWYTEPGVSFVNFPRCYVLGFPDHFNMFVDDFRQTACTSLLKWLVESYERARNCILIESIDGDVPITVLQFAYDRCRHLLEFKKHHDIDKNYERIWDHEWEQFLSNYYKICHGTSKIVKQPKQQSQIVTMYKKSKLLLTELEKYCPEINGDGIKNIWILKPGNKCRGRGIQLIKTIEAVEKIVNLKLKYVVQKYIERPLLIYQTKFDIRQWFLVTNTQPLVIWMYRECYLRFSSQIFNLDNFHESLHLTNHSIQCKYTNEHNRNELLPKDNMWDCHTFKTYLNQIGYPNKWNDTIYPGMKESIICAMLSSQEVMDRRPNTFELYGADFMVTEDFKPWLIEINCSPDLSLSTSVTKRMCPKCLEDLIKVTVDRRRNPQADTGLFECIYRQNYPRTPPFLGMNLSLRGRRMFRNRVKVRLNDDDENKQQQQQQHQQQHHLQQLQHHQQQHHHQQQQSTHQTSVQFKKIDDVKKLKNLPEIKSKALPSYTGPVIENLIDNIRKKFNDKTTIKNKTQSAPPVVKKDRKNKSKRK